MLKITSLYLGINILLFITLAINVIRIRQTQKVSLGDGGREDLMRATRAFGNNAEYLAVVFILLMLLELYHTSPVILHLLGAFFTLGRITHALAITGQAGKNAMLFRVGGMVITLTVLALGAVYLIIKFFAA